MNRRKFLQLSAIVPIAALSCKQQKVPVVSKHIKQPMDDLQKYCIADAELSLRQYEARRHDLGTTDRYKVVPMKVTAYCPCKKCCGRWADGVTASGHNIESFDEFVAADKRYPFGTWMYVPGYGLPATQVLDRGGAIKGNHIDVYFDTHQEVLE